MENEVYEIKQLDKSCWEIRDGSGESMHVSCFLFVGKDKAMLVDTGFGNGDLKAAVESLTSLPVMLVNTHADGDHILNNKQFGPAHMSPAEYDRYHQSADKKAPVAPLWEGDVIDIGGRSFEVVLIPGHTPGSIVLLDAENRLLIGGDSITAGLIFLAGPGRDIKGFIESMKKMKGIEGRFDKVYASHGETVVGSEGLIDELITAAEKVAAGEVEGAPGPVMRGGFTANVYTVGRIKLLYEPE
ncbi:MAG: MBL fold metallo-hydrolase [Peptococcaceae bacterium]|nr:MBL fold metallo-hydrolase [Peptococcaceae bacterium]